MSAVMPDHRDERERVERRKAWLLTMRLTDEQATWCANHWDAEDEPEVGEVEATFIAGFPRTKKPPTAD